MLKKRSPANSIGANNMPVRVNRDFLRSHNFAMAIAANGSPDLSRQPSRPLMRGQKSRDPMRGPLGSLIAQSSARTISKKRFPHRFLPSAATPPQVQAKCHSAAARQETQPSFQLNENATFISRLVNSIREPPLLPPPNFAIRSDSRSICSDIGTTSIRE